MSNTNHILISRNLPLPNTSTSSDNSYSLRKMLRRGVAEAYYRYRLYDGDKAFYYKRLAFQLEDLTDDLDGMLNEKGTARVDHRITIIRAVQGSYDLLALDHAETIADYRNLMADLTRDVCPECQGAMVGA